MKNNIKLLLLVLKAKFYVFLAWWIKPFYPKGVKKLRDSLDKDKKWFNL